MKAVDMLKSGLEGSSRNLDRTLNGLTNEELNWHPNPDANSIALILFHVARSEDSIINGLVRGKEQVWQTGKWYEKLDKEVADGGAHYTAEQVENWIMPDIDDIKAYMAAVRAEVNSYLNTLTDEDLDGKLNFEEGKAPPFEPVVGVFLQLAMTHAYGHAGEISYIRGLKRGMDK